MLNKFILEVTKTINHEHGAQKSAINTITDSIKKINETYLNLNKEFDKNKENYFYLKNGQNLLEANLKRLKKGKLSIFG